MKMRFIILTFLLVKFSTLIAQSLQISNNQRYLVRSNGAPFFYLGDTAWELFHRLDAEEAKIYLENRARKGFTVVQAVVLAQLGGLTVGNAYGDLPLEAENPEKPLEPYFQHVDRIINMANDLGLVVGLLPTWGSYWSTTNGTEKIFNEANARSFGTFLGKRYKDNDLIWILGGDENINNAVERRIIEAMAEGLKSGDENKHLITFHPRGPGMSSDYFHTSSWLDFNMYQSSHGGHDHDNGLYAERDYQLKPIKPTLDGEPRYELIPSGFYFAGADQNDLFSDDDVRQAAYWSILSGACGHTYGHNSIWQMWDEKHAAVLGAKVPWYEAIDHPGSQQMKYLKNLFELRPFYLLVPDQTLILAGPRDGGEKIRSAISSDHSFMIIYSPQGASFTINKNRIMAEKSREIWYNPRYGISHTIHTSNTLGIQTYTPPTKGIGNDWILIIEDERQSFPLPGQVNR